MTPRLGYQHTFTTTADLPIGRIRVFASASSGANWSANWQEKIEGNLEATIPQIAKDIKRAVPTIAEQIAESRRQAEIRHQEWLVAEDRRKRAEDRRRIEESIKTSTGQLQQVIERWQGRASVEKFFDELASAISLAPEEQRADLVERLRLAKEFAGSVDPLDFFRAWKTPNEIYQPVYLDQVGDGQ